MLDIKEKHIPEVFFANAARFADQPMLGYKTGGEWKTLSWREVEARVRRLALGLAALGVGRGDHVALFSPNRPEWAIADLAIMSAARADIPIYPTNSAPEAEYILNDSGSKAIILASQEHFDRIQAVRARCPALKHIITMDRVKGGEGDPAVLHWDDVLALGERHADPDELRRRIEAIEPTEMATLIYTSGTTGPPKGVMLTHRNFMANCYQAALSHEGVIVPGGETLSFLPLSHVLERLGGWYLPMFFGATIYYAESPTTVVDDMKVVRPYYVTSVPRIFEKIHAAVHAKVAGAPPVKRKLFSWSVGVGAQAIPYWTQGRAVPFPLSFKLKLARKLVLDKLRAGLGMDRLMTMITGGGPLAKEIQAWFLALGVPLHEAYGLTETSPLLTTNTFEAMRVGTVGRAATDTEIKIAADGEIMVRGPQVMKGYYNKPEATREVLSEDGWFATGDVGVLDADGFLKITDRKKELFITSGGKNISPANLENAMVTDSFIETIVTVGDRRPFISALIVPDFAVLEAWAREKGLAFASRAELLASPEVRRLFEERLTALNAPFGKVEQVKKFALLPSSFSQETGELTPTMKLKRKAIAQKYGMEIEEMYG
ncbi:MAG: long-chain fatty acid--CoA ligase [Myxococcales bacterium]|nr:MAG: long-chain fatty acid--CoA ligase [Myxococcales bacterium]